MRIRELIKNNINKSDTLRKELGEYTNKENLLYFRGDIGLYLLSDGLEYELMNKKTESIICVMLVRIIKKYLKSINFDYWLEQSKY